MSTPYLGEIRAVGFNFPPEGWATCNGQMLNISENDALFTLLSTTYGGDGQTTFGVPDLRGRVAVGSQARQAGPGLTAYPLGQTGGVENVTLSTAQIPAHGHTYSVPLSASTAGTVSNNPAGKLPGSSSSNAYATSAGSGSLAAGAVTGVAVSATGGSQPHPNVQPVLALNYIICTAGIFPPQP